MENNQNIHNGNNTTEKPRILLKIYYKLAILFKITQNVYPWKILTEKRILHVHTIQMSENLKRVKVINNYWI